LIRHFALLSAFLFWAAPSLAEFKTGASGSLPDEFLGFWESFGLGDDVRTDSPRACTGELGRITSKLMNWDALGYCHIATVESDPRHINQSPRNPIKVTLSCDGMYHPLKDTQIWYTFVINGETFMTQVTVGNLFDAFLYKKCEPSADDKSALPDAPQ
jgi:hypothetical protein